MNDRKREQRDREGHTTIVFEVVQALWWLAGAITLIVRSGRISIESGNDSIITSA